MTDRPVLADIDLAEAVARTNLSEVWFGWRRSNGAPVAVKFAASPSGEEGLRLESERVRALLGAGAGRVVPAEYVAEPVPHLVLPWKGKRTFRDVIEGIRGGDDRARAVRLLLRVADEVALVHAAGFLHGDLKPENILVDDEGAPWLTDFGMARVIRSARMESRVSVSMDRSTAGWGGTLSYLPPEGLHRGEPSRAWDVYALGVMLHEVLLGRRPDRATTPEELRTSLPPGIVRVLLGALAYLPADRYANADRLREELDLIERELTATGPLRWAHGVKRVGVRGLAAFFVALRYVAVFALVASYLAVVLLGVSVHPAFLAIFIPIALLHRMVRWEGPETSEEARLRRGGRVVRRR